MYKIKTKYDITICTPADINLMTPYVLLEQEEWFEPELNFIQSLLQPGMTSLDIGACFGVYTLTMAKAVGPEGQVFAFEPASQTRDYLQSSSEENNLDNITIIPQALSSQTGQTKLTAPETPELGTITDEASFADTDTIDMTTLDVWWQQADRPQIDLIKLDVNGHEAQIIHSGQEIFTQSSPIILLSIKHNDQFNHQAVQALTELGFELYQYLPGPDILARFDDNAQPDAYLLNLFAIKPETATRLQDQGLVAPEELEVPEPEAGLWRKHLAALPWTMPLFSTWQRHADDPAYQDYLQALNFLCAAQDPKASPSQKLAQTQWAAQNLIQIYSQDPSHSVALTLTRALQGLGQQQQAAQILDTLVQHIQSGNPVEENLPFLPPLASFDHVPIQDSAQKWLMARCMESLIFLRSHSGYFSQPQDQKLLQTLHKNPDRTLESQRRLALIGLRQKRKITIKETSSLLSEREKNRNVWFWKSLKEEPQQTFSRSKIFEQTRPKPFPSAHDSMRVMHLSTLEGGGAGVAARRLHTGLRRQGYDSSMCVLNKTTNDPTVKLIQGKHNNQAVSLWPYLHAQWSKTLQQYPNRSRSLCFFSTPNSITQLEQYIAEHDVINMHWIAGLVDIKSMPRLFAGKKLIWTLHDMNPFTGGCHYAQDCTRYETGCYNCPQLGKGPEDIVKKVWEIKAESYKHLNLIVVTPSNWLGECSKKSALLGKFEHKVIPNGLDIQKFSPVEKEKARQKLSLPQNSKIILFGASGIGDYRKGFDLFLEAIKKLPAMIQGRDIELAVFGHAQNLNQVKTSYKLNHLGHLNNPAELAAAYSAADVYVIPSREDNLPNTMLESLACGTPVASFNVGGIPDMVIHKQTGYLATFPDTDELALGIKWILQEEQVDFKNNCREKAEKEITLEIQAQRYLQAYETLQKQPFKIKTATKNEILDYYHSIVPRAPKHASYFLNTDRFDVVAKYIYIKFLNRKIQSEWGKKVYARHLVAWNGAKELSPAKNSIQEYATSFNHIIQHIQNGTFNFNKSPILLDAKDHVLDGSHRLAAAVYFDKKVRFAYVGEKGAPQYLYTSCLTKNDGKLVLQDGACPFYNLSSGVDYQSPQKHHRTYQNSKMEQKYSDAVALEYAWLKKKNTFAVMLYPTTRGTKTKEAAETLKAYSKIFYYKRLNLTPKQALNLVVQTYLEEDWIGNIDNNFNLSDLQYQKCFTNNSDIRIFLVEADDVETALFIKNEIRSLYNIGKHSVHTTDAPDEMWRIATSLLNENSLHMLNNLDYSKCKNMYKMFLGFKKWLKENNIDPNDVCITGSSTMALYGLRDAKDIDYLHRIDHRYPDTAQIKSHLSEKNYYPTNFDDIIYNPENHFYFEGIKFASLDMVKQMKAKRGEEKDKRDVELVDSINNKTNLNQNAAKSSNRYVSQTNSSNVLNDNIIKDSKSNICWLTSYPKSGNTWLRFLIGNLFFGSLDHYKDQEKHTPDVHLHKQIDIRNKECAFIKTHWMFHDSMPGSKNTLSAICIVRNPFDVLVSNMNYLKADTSEKRQALFEEFIKYEGVKRWMKAGFGTYTKHTRSWIFEDLGFPVLYLRYRHHGK